VRNHKNSLFHCLSSHLGEKGSLEQENLPLLSEDFQLEQDLVHGRALVLFSSLIQLFAFMIE